MAETIKIAELTLDASKAIKSSQEYLTEINRLKEAQRLLKERGDESSAAFVENDANLKNLNKSYRDSQKLASSLLEVNKDFERTLSSENKSNLELLDSRRQLQEIVKSVQGDTEEEIQLRDTLNDAIDEQTEALRDQSSDFVASKDKIGEYQNAIENAIPANSFLGQAISTVKSGLNVVTPLYDAYKDTITSSVSGIRNAAAGTEGLTAAQKAQAIATNIATNALRLFKVALAATGIGLILVGLGALVSFLTSTQEGIDKVNSVLTPLKVTFQRILGVIQQFGKTIFDAFSDPKQLIIDIGNALKDNIEKRFEAVIRIAKRFIDLDFDGIGEDFVQAATGVEDFGAKAAGAFNKVKGFIGDSIAIGKELADLAILIEKTESDLVVTRAQLRAEYEKQREIAQDLSNSAQERKAATQVALGLQDELLAKEQGLLDLKIKEKEIQNSLNDTSREDQKDLNEIIAERTELESQAARKRASTRNLEKSINAEIANARKAQLKEEEDAKKAAALLAVKNAEIEIEIFKENNKEKLEADGELNQARINAALAAALFIKDAELAIIQDKLDKGIIAENEANLARLQKQGEYNAKKAELEQEYFDQQEELRQEREEAAKERAEAELEREQFDYETKQELELARAETKAEQEQLALEQRREREVAAAEKLGADVTGINARYAILQAKLDKKVNDQKVGMYADAFGILAGLVDENTALAKASAIAQATINTYLGASKALAEYSYPLGPIFAGLTIAQGLLQVSNIAGVKFAKGGLQEVGGRSHAGGGTKFVGEDGTGFEAEKGELIGVMNKRAAKAFMAFNNSYGFGKSANGRYEGGGAFTAGSAANRFIRSQNSQGIDYDLLAAKVAQANRQLPPNVLDIRDFYAVDNKVQTVEQGANV